MKEVVQLRLQMGFWEMFILNKIKEWLLGKPKRDVNIYVVDLADSDTWVTDSNKFKCAKCGSLTITNDEHALCSRCNVIMEKV
jgi:hypothetical protein